MQQRCYGGGSPGYYGGAPGYGGVSGSHRAGACFKIGGALDLNIEATRREGSDGADHGVMFRFRLEF